MTDKILSMLGIAQKGRMVVSGEFCVDKAIKEGSAKLCIVADDASDNTTKAFYNSCAYYHVPCVKYSNKESLGRALGKESRATLALTDEKMAASIIVKLEQLNVNVTKA